MLLLCPATQPVQFVYEVVVVVPPVEFVPDGVVREVGEDGEGTARMLGRLMKPSPAMTPSMTTIVSLALAPIFKLRSALLSSSP